MRKGRIFSEETRRKMSEKAKGKVVSVETRKKMSLAKLGKRGYHHTDETKRKMSERSKGHPVSEDQRRKQSEAMIGKPAWNKGKYHTMEARKKMSEALKGRAPWNKGLEASQEARKRLSDAHMGYIPTMEQRRKQSEALRGRSHSEEHNRRVRETKGTLDARKAVSETSRRIIFEKRGIICADRQYSWDWNETLRRAIRERDNYTCQVCGKEYPPNGGRKFHVHHIDYNKKNCNPENLITLCISCHMKTTVGNSEEWKNRCVECLG